MLPLCLCCDLCHAKRKCSNCGQNYVPFVELSVKIVISTCVMYTTGYYIRKQILVHTSQSVLFAPVPSAASSCGRAKTFFIYKKTQNTAYCFKSIWVNFFHLKRIWGGCVSDKVTTQKSGFLDVTLFKHRFNILTYPG